MDDTPMASPEPEESGAELREESSEEVGPALNASARFRVRVLLLSILLVALCSITYELIIGTISSYLLGNSVYQFSLTIGLYMSAMGVGSYLSKYVRERLLLNFLIIEVCVGVLGGVSSAALFGIFTYARGYFQPAMWLITLGIGVLVGLEIPLLTRHVRRYAQLREAIANVLSWDYLGALLGSLAFPLLLLPAFGLLNSAALVGMVNLLVAAGGLIAFRREVPRWKGLMALIVVSWGMLLALFFGSSAYESFLDKRLFQDPVIYREQTPYQKLTLTSWKGKDYRLYINGNIQFSSADEYRYHEALVHVPMGLVPDARRVLIMGGGDGLAVKQLVAHYPELEQIVLVDLDPRMTALGKENGVLERLNGGALHDARVQIVNDDAMNYAMQTSERFDVVIIDLPDPNNESLSKLYSVEFYRIIKGLLTEGGAMVTQSTASYHAVNAFWCIHRTIEAAFCPEAGCPGEDAPQYVVPYHAWIPSFGDWGFNLARRAPIDPATLTIRAKETRFVDDAGLEPMLSFPRDISEREVERNRLISPVLLTYYQRDWHANNQ